MKKIFKSIATLAICGLAFLGLGCSNISVEEKSNDGVTGWVSLANPSRTAFADASKSTPSSIVLTATDSDENSKSLGTWTTFAEATSARIALKKGSYTFKLTVLYGTTKLEGTETKEIEAGKTTALSFALVQTDGTGNGNLSVKVDLSAVLNASYIESVLTTTSGTIAAAKEKTPVSEGIALYEKSIANGTYFFDAWIYDEGGAKLAPVSEVVKITAGLLTSAELTVSAAAINTTSSITYVSKYTPMEKDGTGNEVPGETIDVEWGLAYGYTGQSSYSVLDGTVELPVVLADGYDFGGWFTDADCNEGNEITQIAPGSGDVTVYAKWTDNGGELAPVPDSAEGLTAFTSFSANDYAGATSLTENLQANNVIFVAGTTSIILCESKSTTIGQNKYSKRLQLNSNGSSGNNAGIKIYIGSFRTGTLTVDCKSGSSDDATRQVLANGVALGLVPASSAGSVSGSVTADKDGYVFIQSSNARIDIYGIYYSTGSGGVEKIVDSDPQLPVIDNEAYAPSYTNGKKVGMRSNIRDINTDSLTNFIYVTPNGKSDGLGTKDSPADLQTAINRVTAGQVILLKGGTYKFSEPVKITNTNNGTASAYKYIIPETGSAALLDFSKMAIGDANRGIQLDGSYWHIYGITCYNAGDNGMLITGNYNRIERCVFQANQDTGLQIARRSSDLTNFADWPHDNWIINCTSFDNKDDKTGENADGFASKLTCGDGNLFDGCISFANCDDGWDLYAKTDRGPIGVVTIRNCVALQNGKTTSGTNYANGDMNGFKLGGSNNGAPTPHVVQNCVAFLNGKDGFTDNGNGGALKVSNCSSYGNVNSNFNFYRTFAGGVFTNLISMNGSITPAQIDKFGGKASECTVQATAEKVLYWGAKATSKNTGFYFADTKTTIGNGDKIGSGNLADPFKSDMKNTTPPELSVNIDATCRNTDGTINLNGFLEAKESSTYASMGAHFGDQAETVFASGL